MRILIVDDDTAIVEVIRDSLNWEKLGITDVQTSCNVEKAKIILKEKQVDIVISDIEMPRESGLDLLKWFREENLPGKFLLLTSYESFQYATVALKYHAEEYLVKPFNVEIMEKVVQKIVQDIKKEKEEQQRRLRDERGLTDTREVSLNFLFNLFSGRIIQNKEEIIRELERRNLMQYDWSRQYCLVVSRITNMEYDIDLYGRAMILFILANLHSEVLCGRPENDSVIYYEHSDYCSFVTVCDEVQADILQEKCNELIGKCGDLLTSTVTCCISHPCQIEDFYDTFHREVRILARNVVYYGESFFEDQVLEYTDEHQPVLKLSQMESYLEEKNKIAFMDYLKKELNAKVKLKVLDGEMLKSICREVQQAVYAHLAKQGIQVSLLLNDTVSVQIAERTSQSVIDTVRWVNHLLGRVFDYEAEVQKSQTIIEKIKAYIQEHYTENIGRNEIGAHFYLVPEYLAKIFKKKTGQNIKDYINEYRLMQAKNLLNNTEMRVSDVAAEVGFDNFSYFSTLFKKYTGMTPNEYRKRQTGQSE